jgi:hypothetical protein
MTRKPGASIVLVLACLAAASTGRAASAGKVCATFRVGRIAYHSQTVGTTWTCAGAKSWIAKLSLDSVPKSFVNDVPLGNGPGGLHCFATPGSKGGHATSGVCVKGTKAFPKSGFAWFPA